LTTERWYFAIDKEAMKEVDDYRKWKAVENKVKKMRTQAPPNTVEHDRYERSCKILEKLLELQWPNSKALDPASGRRVIRWVKDEGQ
jgi:hypothetical protein